MKKRQMGWQEVYLRAEEIAQEILENYEEGPLMIYGIPRGGIPVAQAVYQKIQNIKFLGVEWKQTLKNMAVLMTTDASSATIFVDDIIDSGATKAKYLSEYNAKSFYALVNKLKDNLENEWFVFPWETMVNEEGPEQNIKRILQYLGEDVNREGLKETPERVIKSWETLYSGYRQKPGDIFKTFDSGNYDQMVILKDIEFYSMCEHHMLPFFGKVHIGYIPEDKVVGASKMARLVEVFARRLQIQERMSQQITEAMLKYLCPEGCGCVIQAQHLCMTARGVEKQSSVFITSSVQGSFLEDSVKEEFVNAVR